MANSSVRRKVEGGLVTDQNQYAHTLSSEGRAHYILDQWLPSYGQGLWVHEHLEDFQVGNWRGDCFRLTK